MLRLIRMIAVITALLACAVNAGMYGEHVEELTASNFDKLVMESTETWLVKFYAPWCGHCQSSAPAFSKAAKKLEGVAKLGVINCDEHQSLAQRFGVQGFPTLKIFKGEGKKARRPADYNAARSAKAFVDHVKYVMPSFVARVKPSGADAFFKDEGKLPHVLLFTDKTTTSPLYKGMSARFKGRVSFGEVRKTDAADLVGKFSVSDYPTLIAFKAGESKPENATTFSGTMDPKSLEKFFASLAQGKEPEAGEEGVGSEEKASEKVFAQPKAYSGDVEVIASTKQYEESCGARKDGRMCGLAILPGGESHSLYADLKPIAERYQYDNMAFAVLDSSVEGGKAFASLFNAPDVGGFIVMRSRKNKYAVLESEEAPDKTKIAAFLDKIVGGDARFKKLTEELPEWVDETAEAEGASGDTSDEGDGEGETEEDEDSGKCGMEPPKDGASCGGPKEDL